MGRKAAPQPLRLSDPAALGEDPRTGETRRQIQSPTSPTSAASPRSPRSPFRFTPKKSAASADRKQQSAQPAEDPQHQNQQHQQHQHSQSLSSHSNSQSLRRQQQPQQRGGSAYDAESPYLPLAATLHQTSLDSPSPSQKSQTVHQQSHPDEPAVRSPKSSGFFFNFHKPSKSAQQLPTSSTGKLQQSNPDLGGDGLSRATDNSAMPSKTSKYQDSSYADHSVQKPTPSLPSKSDLSLASANDYDTASPQQPNAPKKGKPKPFGILSRTKSVRDKDGSSPRKSPRELRDQREQRDPATPPPVRVQEVPQSDRSYSYGNSGLRTAPVPQDRSFRDMMTSAVRNRSEDRSAPRDMPNKEHHRDKEQPRTQPSSYRENGGGSAFFSGLKNSSTRAADMIRGGLFGKGTRSGSTSEREFIVDDEHYVLKVINLPLVEQTRLTRISKRLEDSRDKTEFWMPAFPWRAIDYLNYKGCDVEGLYRVPGSGPQIKKWQRKFDEEYDVDLFAQDDLYDINIIGSMLKAWLRELPDELFPKEAQERIARECAGADTVPQLLVEELSNLSPFNYYLLFAITCHLSLLLAHADKNKMDFRNLCICFQPCMKIDAFCFKFLVCDWRDCWKGCKSEARFIEEEYQLFDQPPPRGLAEPRKPIHDELQDDRNISSSDSSKQSSQDGQKGRLKKKALQLSESNGSAASTPSTNLTIDSSRETPRKSGDIRPLSPIKPLSPLGF